MEKNTLGKNKVSLALECLLESCEDSKKIKVLRTIDKLNQCISFLKKSNGKIKFKIIFIDMLKESTLKNIKDNFYGENFESYLLNYAETKIKIFKRTLIKPRRKERISNFK